MNEDIKEVVELSNLGLSQDEATIYLLLLSRGSMYASAIARASGVSRVLTYRILDQLTQKELVSKVDNKGAITKFHPLHPFGLTKLIGEERRRIEKKEKSLESVIGSLSTQYLRLTGEPGVRILVGVNGYAEMLKEIERTIGTVYLMRTENERDSPLILDMIQKHIKRRVIKKIPTKLLSPYNEAYPSTLINWDRENLVERRFVNKGELMTAAQVTIFGEQVAIVAYRSGDPIITIIHNTDIAHTFLMLFEFVWLHTKGYSEKMHEQLIRKGNTSASYDVSSI
jgi:sugar-specific transcriptional regulator TrmB